MNRDLITECRTVLKRCEGALQGVLDYVPSKLAADILREVIAIVGRIDKQTSKEHVDGFLIRALESVAEGLEKGGSPASATRELRRLLAGVEDCSDETSCVGCAQGWHRQPNYPDSTKHVHCPPRFIDCTAQKAAESRDALAEVQDMYDSIRAAEKTSERLEPIHVDPNDPTSPVIGRRLR